MSSFQFNKQKATSYRHRIAEEIRRAILEEKLKPGDRLVELELSKQMGVSRGPIREALRVLEQEGLIHSEPYKGTVVAEFSPEEVINVLIPIRLTVEIYALRKALPLMTDEDFEFLETCVESMRTSGEKRDLWTIVENDLAFHEFIIRKSQVANVINIWSIIFNRIRLHFIIQSRNFEDMSLAWVDHKNLVAAFKTMDIETACTKLSNHIYESNISSLGIELENDIPFLPSNKNKK